MNRTIQLFVFCFLTGITSAQITQKKWFSYKLRGYEVHMSSDIQNKNRQIKDAAFNGQSSINTYFESLQLNGYGSLYHPNLMLYTLTAGLGINQNTFSQSFSKNGKTKNNNFFQNIAFQSIWLGTKPYNIIIGYRRKYRKINSNFFDDSISQDNSWTAKGNWRTPTFKMNIDFGNDKRLEEYGNREIYAHEKRSGFRGSWGDPAKGNGAFNLNQNRVERVETGLYNTDIKNTTLQLTNSLPLKNHGKTTIYSSLFGNRIQSDKDIINVNISTRANYQWSKTLTFDGGYFFRYNDTQEQVSNNHTFNANLNHQLYASLATQLMFQEDILLESQYQKKGRELNAEWKYTKKLPLGRLFIDYAYKPRSEDIHSEYPLFRWVEDIYSFDNFNTIVLRQDNIKEESVEIYDETGVVQYFSNLDFVIYVYDNRIEIQKTPLSSIPDSSDVLIRYSWGGRTDEGSQSTAEQFGISYEYQSFLGINVGFKNRAMKYPKQAWTTLTKEDEKQERSYFLNLEYSPVSIRTNYTVSNSSITPYERLETNINTILGSYLTQYILLNVQYGSEYLPLRHDTQINTIISVELFRRLTRSLKVNSGFTQKIVDGKLNKLFEQRWYIQSKMENRKMALVFSYEKLIYRFFKEIETDQHWKFQIDFKN